MSSNNDHLSCTIISKNYVSYARTFCNSFLDHHTEGKCFVLIIDDINGYIDIENENFELITLDTLEIPNVRDLCFKYNVTELSTAVKPFLLYYLLSGKDIKKILYLDPDILVTDTLDDLYNSLDKHDIILTPHLDMDYPDDGQLPDDRHIMRSGIFNLGFIGLKQCANVENFLRWWQSKLLDKCVIDFEAGYFVDQKFIDMALTLFPNIGIIKDIGYNVAYWNIHSREIQQDEDNWRCNDGPLYFFHFSDYKPSTPNIISRHQNRFNLEENKDLKNLFRLYDNLLIGNGIIETSSWKYTYNYYENGKKIQWYSRQLFRLKSHTMNYTDPFLFANYSLLFKFQALLLWFRKAINYCFKKFFHY